MKEEKAKHKISRSSLKRSSRIFEYLRPYKYLFFLGWVFLLISSSTGLFFPYLLGQLLGGDVRTSEMGNGENFFQNIDLNNINVVALLLLFIFVLQSAFSFFQVVIFTKVTENAMRDIRKDAFSRLIYMPMNFFNKNKVGELTSRISADITLIQDTLRSTIAEFFRQVIIIIGSIIFITIISWKLALIMLGTVPVMAIFAVIFGRFIRKLSKKAQKISAESNTIIEESLVGIVNVKAFTNEALMLGKYLKSINSIRRLNITNGVWRGAFVSFVILFLFGTIVFIIWQGLHMTMEPNSVLEKKDFFSFIMFTVFMGASISALPDLYSTIQRAIGSTEHLLDIMEENTEKDLNKGEKTPSIQGEIEFKNVRFSYPERKETQVLDDLSFQVRPGDQIALVGASGAGKSTIAALLLRLYDIQGGTYKIDGINVEEYALMHLRKNMAVVPQEVILFSGSIRENILFGQPEATEEEIVQSAKKANAYDFIMNFPEGLDTEVGDRGVQLSGGQKQRIAIARAILKDPTILILDEATSALDTESESLVQEALDRLMENRTTFIIAHRLTTIRKADVILVIEKGKVVESGSHEELIQRDSGRYAQLNRI